VDFGGPQIFIHPTWWEKLGALSLLVWPFIAVLLIRRRRVSLSTDHVLLLGLTPLALASAISFGTLLNLARGMALVESPDLASMAAGLFQAVSIYKVASAAGCAVLGIALLHRPQAPPTFGPTGPLSGTLVAAIPLLACSSVVATFEVNAWALHHGAARALFGTLACVAMATVALSAFSFTTRRQGSARRRTLELAALAAIAAWGILSRALADHLLRLVLVDYWVT
jgi:hypothetical protein